jgi:hypothetical protein
VRHDLLSAKRRDFLILYRYYQWYIEEIIFSLKHYWRFVDSEALELKALSQGVDEKAA